MRTRRDRFAFAGVGFEILSDAARAPIADEYLACSLPLAGAEIVADVACSLRVEPGAAEPPGYQVVSWRIQGEETRVTAPGVDATLCRLGPARFALTALLRPRPDAVGTLLRGASAAILQQQGGLTLHAVGLEVGGEAVLFMGPSGAGKSTAATLVPGARVFAHDHVALVPRAGGGWLAWALPGGTPSAAPRSSARVLPLGALLRVRRGPRQPSFRAHTGAEALFLLRESVESGDSALGSEELQLATLMRLASDTAVGEVTTVLGKPMHAELARYLERER